MKTLRPYQEECVESIFNAWEEVQRDAIQLATGAGKSVIIAETVKRWREENPSRKRVVFLVHRAEILRSCADTIAQQCPDAVVRIVDGSVQNTQRWKNLTADIVLFNTATLGVSKSAREKGSARARNSDLMHSYLTGVGLVVIDECHRAVSATAMDCLTQLRVFEPDGPNLLGCTATLFRDDNGDLSNVFERRSFAMGLVELISDGFLVPPRHMTAMVDGLDLTKVGSARTAETGGEMDLKASELAKVLEESGAYGVVAEFTKRHAEKRKTLVFTPNVESAERVSDELNARGIKSAPLSGTTPSAERAAIFNQLQYGDLQAIVNCQIATEGTDLPAVSCVVLARPTRSRSLYRQIVGRGVRLFTDPVTGEEKKDALIIDLVGATTRNDLATISDLDDEIGDVMEGESITDAVNRHREEKAEAEQYEEDVFAALLGMGMDAEEAAEVVELAREVTGSFNLVEITDPYTEAVKRSKAAAQEKEKREAAKKRKRPSFPSDVERYGWWIKAGETAMFLSTASFDNRGTKGSYIAVLETVHGWVAFRKDTRQRGFAGEGGQYHFISMRDDSTPFFFPVLEEAERHCLDWAFNCMEESSGEINYRLNPNSDSKKKPASPGQIQYMRASGCGDPEAWDLYDAEEIKPPTAGVASDMLDRMSIAPDVIRQSASIRKYLGV